MHRRTRIRNRAADLLDGIATVSKSRVHNWQENDLPGISVYTLEEPSIPVNVKRQQERSLNLVLDIFARTTGDVDEDLDDLCVSVEKAIESDYRFSGLALVSNLSRTTIGLSGEADQRHGTARLEYTVTYRTQPDAPDA